MIVAQNLKFGPNMGLNVPTPFKDANCTPRKLPIVQYLLTQGKNKIAHPNPEVFQMTAWLLSTTTSKYEAFLRTLESCCHSHGDLELGDCSSKFRKIKEENLSL